MARLTVQSLRRAQGLEQAQDALHAALEILILRLHRVSRSDDILQFLKGLLALQLLDALLQVLNRILCALPDGALSLSVVCALLGQLLGREVGYTSR